ncbi:MAG: glycosyltransferase family 39 protein [Anaerolineae bacterium]|nr:glycosyltransferase family 39 protein [Anaerolineae bacterium]
MNARWLKPVTILLSALAVLVFIGYLAVYVVYATALFQWPFDYDQGEGFELYDAVLYLQGEWPYRDNAAFPFYASNYPPLFHLLIVPLLPIFGPRLVAGRLVSFAATLVTAAVIALVVRRKARGWVLPALAGLAFLASNIVYQIGPLCRLHVTMVMFETLAVAFIAEFEHPRHGTRNLLIGLALLLCAGYTKQLAIFTVAAALSYVFLRDVKKALVSGVGLAVAVGALFLLIDRATAGQWMVNIIQANVNEFDYRQTLGFLRQWFDLYPVLIVLATGLFIYELFWERLSVYSIWYVFALGMGLLSGKWGAGPGYFVTSIAAACILAGLALARLESACVERAPWQGQAARLLVPLLFLIQATFTVHLPTSGAVFGPLAQALGVADRPVQGDCATFDYYDSSGYTQLGHLLTRADYAAGDRIMEYVTTSDGPVFSEEAAFSLLAGEPVITNPTQLLNLYKNDLLDTTEIIARIERQEFGVVIFRAQFYPQPVLDAIGQNYQPVDHICMNGFYYHILWPQRRLSETGE